MLRKQYIVIAALAGLVMSGCKKEHFDINKNPNQATSSAITPDLTIAAQLTSSANRNASSYDFLHRWMGYWSASGSYSRSTVEMSYNITNSFAAGLWEGGYYTANQYKLIEDKSAQMGWTLYQGISKLMKNYEIMNIVDVYNNVPYTKAFDLAGNILPAYDKGEDVYKAINAEIDAAIKLIKEADVNVNTNIAKVDVMFKGDQTKWIKFANTLKLKLLIHTSKTTTFTPATEIAKINATGVGYLGNGLSAEVQPGYTVDRPNPYYAAHQFNPQNGNEADNYNRANNFVLSIYTSLLDPRAAYFYRAPKNGGALKGTDYGSDPNTATNSDVTSGPRVVASHTSPMFVLTSVEAAFLIAEATARGWISGNAQSAYNAAVTESFVWLGVPNAAAAATTYLATANPKVEWPSSGALNDQLAVIAWQKYLSLNGINALETWTDVRRLKVVAPALSIAPERGTNQIPVRLLYPASEYSYNSAAVKAEGTISQFTSKIFWDK